MSPRRRPRRSPGLTPAGALFEADEPSVLEVLDSLLNRGVVATGDVVLGVAGVDLVYLKLSALLCAADRLTSPRPRQRRLRSRRKR